MVECREWIGARSHGYGVVGTRRHGTRLVHRITAAEKYGWDAIRGKVVMHTCDNPPCYEPEHLVIGTQAENLADALQKGRRKIPDPRHSHKLTIESVREILASSESGPSLARRYGVSHQVIYAIRKRRIWAHA